MVAIKPMITLTAEQQTELAKFPPPLRTLIELELEAGNSIIEVGHSFPAPPVGAFFKLAKRVSTRPRASGSGLDFYDQNSSSYSGEFTDAKRFFFVLEAPNPQEDEPVIQRTEKIEPELHRILQSSTKTDARWLLHFQDARPPQDIQFHLERMLMTLMPPRMREAKLICNGHIKRTGAPTSFLLTFEAAVGKVNHYSLRVEASWAQMDPKQHEYFQNASSSWFEFWTRDFMRASPPAPGQGSKERYQELCEMALNAEAHLNSVGAIQQAIVAAMKKGATFSTAHKEGGTIIKWRDGLFVRSDYGESEELKEYSNEAEFLKFLREFYDWETSRNVYPNKVPDIEAWKLILRLLHSK